MRSLLENYDIVSGASIDGAYLEIPMRRGPLERKLKELGPFRLAPAAQDNDGNASLVCELWRIAKGRLMPGGIDQRALWTGVGDALDGFGARLFGERSAFWGPLSRSLNDALSAPPYHELVIGVPDVHFDGRDSLCYTLVLGMVTDSRIAMSLDWWSGYGYRKQLGTFSYGAGGEFRVDVDSGPLVSAIVEPVHSRNDDFSWLNARWRQPLLGCVNRGSFSESRLVRSITPETHCQLASGQIELHPTESEPALNGLEKLRQRRGQGGRAALYTSVTTCISVPRRAEARRRSKS